MTIKTIRDFELSGKTIFMRLDFNVPLSEPNAKGERKVEDDNRIREALPTIQYALDQGARLVIGSHLGRPDGTRNLSYSMLPIAARLSELLPKHEVNLADDCIGEGIEFMARQLKLGQILLLENLRFHSEEEANDPEFARQLSRIGQIYITDAFGTAHRKHASTYGVPAILAQKGMGFLIEKELTFLDPLLNAPAKPFFAILGGSKVTDKLKTIEELMKRVDGLMIGGAMAHAFWAAQGISIPEEAKQPKPADIEAARGLLARAKSKDLLLVTPLDTNRGFDIGPKTVEKMVEVLSRAKTVFWNGPLGWFEKPEYSQGTFEVARALAQMACVKVVGGGDTVSAIKQSGVADQYDHLSTGGGAVLEYLEGHGLPGIDILKSVGRSSSNLNGDDL